LIYRICRLQGYLRVVHVPEIEDLERLEVGLEKLIPAWVKYARLAVELEQLQCENDWVAWVEARSHGKGAIRTKLSTAIGHSSPDKSL